MGRLGITLALGVLVLGCSNKDKVREEAVQKRCDRYSSDATLAAAKYLGHEDSKADLTFVIGFAMDWERRDCPVVVTPLIEPCVAEYTPGTDSFLTCIERRAPDREIDPSFFAAMTEARAQKEEQFEKEKKALGDWDWSTPR